MHNGRVACTHFAPRSSLSTCFERPCFIHNDSSQMHLLMHNGRLASFCLPLCIAEGVHTLPLCITDGVRALPLCIMEGMRAQRKAYTRAHLCMHNGCTYIHIYMHTYIHNLHTYIHTLHTRACILHMRTCMYAYAQTHIYAYIT